MIFAPFKDTIEESSSTVVDSLGVEESSKHQQIMSSSLLNDDTNRAEIMCVGSIVE